MLGISEVSQNLVKDVIEEEENAISVSLNFLQIKTFKLIKSS